MMNYKHLKLATCEVNHCSTRFYVDMTLFWDTDNLQCKKCFKKDLHNTLPFTDMDKEKANFTTLKYGFCLSCRLWKNDIYDTYCQSCQNKIIALNTKLS